MSGRGDLGRAAVALVTGLAVVTATSTVAVAQEAPGIRLEAARRAIEFGESVLLRGSISPPSEGETVSVIDHEGRERATATTNEDGRYRMRLTPRRSTTLRARWLALVSDPVRVKVRPKVRVSLARVRLFGRARVRGTVMPRQDSRRITVTLFRGHRRFARDRLRLRDGHRFSMPFRIRKAATYRSTASFTDAAGVRGRDSSPRVAPPLPSLSQGSRGIFVGLLENRLRDLAYRLDVRDRRFTAGTADALRAFNKVEGRERLGTVDAATWRALASTRRATPRVKTDGFHIEVDQTRQVLLAVRNGRVNGIVHVSTGANGYTHDGIYRVFRKIDGYSGGRLYYPSYFDGRRALHGWPEVPTYNASHGCVRLPMWSARWVYGKAGIGTTIHIYH